MRICVFGAGAIGSWLGVQLIRTGHDVTFIARGAQLEAMQTNGLRVESSTAATVEAVRATSNAFELPAQDITFVTLKSHSIPSVAEELDHLSGTEGFIVTAVNGIPWWYFHGIELDGESGPVRSVDPQGDLWRVVRPQRTLGCVVYPSVELVEPGHIRHISDNRMPLGEPNGIRTERVEQTSELLETAGFRAPIRKRLRNDIWLKLLGNVAFNPLSVLTGKTLDRLAKDADTRQLARAIMEECRTVSEALGARIVMSLDKRLDGAAAVGAHKTSMLQDFERGRPLERAAIIDGVIELARRVGVPTPTINRINEQLTEFMANHEQSSPAIKE